MRNLLVVGAAALLAILVIVALPAIETVRTSIAAASPSFGSIVSYALLYLLVSVVGITVFLAIARVIPR